MLKYTSYCIHYNSVSTTLLHTEN